MKRLIFYTIFIAGLNVQGCQDLSNSLKDRLVQSESAEQEERPITEDSTNMDLLISRIGQQSRLYTAEYHVNKIVTHEDLLKLKGEVLGINIEHHFNIGDRRIAIPIEVTLKAYVDFSHFTARQVQRRGSLIHIILPDPQIILTSSKVDHQGIKQFRSLWRSAYSDEEMTDFTRQGVESILADVPRMRLMQTARDCAAQTLIPLLTSLGYQEDHIIITFREGIDANGLGPIEGLENIGKLIERENK